MTLSLTLVLPAHNEGGNIAKTLMEIDANLPIDTENFIYVSEDGSQDNTRLEVIEFSEIANNCKVILSLPSSRLGYSRGVVRGIKECQTDLIGFVDADGQFDPKDLASLLLKIEPGKVIIGYRNPRIDSRLRIIYSKAFGLAYRIFGGPKRIDPSSPFVLCYLKDIEFLKKITPCLDYGFWWEFQIRINHVGLDVIEVPVEHRSRSNSVTQIYSLKRIPRIVITHLKGLYDLRKELKLKL